MFLPVEKWGLSVAQTASLSGELLESQEALPGNETTVGGACDRDAGTTLSFTTTGAAQGPYVGTFVETGTITIGPQTNTEIDSRGVGAILAFEASFTIQSEFPPATITGSKSLSPTAPTEPTLAGGFGRCEPDGADPPTAVFAVITNANVLYQAEIDAPTAPARAAATPASSSRRRRSRPPRRSWSPSTRPSPRRPTVTRTSRATRTARARTSSSRPA